MISYRTIIHKTKTRRSISISVKPNLDVIVSTPKNTPDAKINEILLEKQHWIQNKVQYFRNAKLISPKFQKIEDGQTIYFLGRKITVRIMNMNSNNISCDGNTIIVHAFYEKAHIILNKWIEAAALQYFQSRLTECFEIFRQKIQCQAPVLKMRKMKKRWGSMSAMRVMTLNLCLIFTDPQCIDYVIMHELCHIKHLNHGTQFHELQAYFTPNWKQIKKQLEEFVIV